MKDMHAEEAVAEWPTFLLDVLAEDIEIANDINPRGWALYSFSGKQNVWPVFGVSHNTVLSYDLAGGITIAFDRELLDESTINLITSVSTPRKLRQEWILTTKLASDSIEQNLRNLLPAHQSVVRKLAEWNASRWRDHQDSVLDLFAVRMGRMLPKPGYHDEMLGLREAESNPVEPERKYDSRVVEPTGFWKIDIDVRKAEGQEDYRRTLQENITIHRYGQNDTDLSQFPLEREEFVRHAIDLKMRDIGDRAANRLWLFTFGVQIGDWILLQAERPAIGQIIGEYVHALDGDVREVDWIWVSESPVDSKIFRQAFNGRNLWGFTTLEPIEFKRILKALGQDSLVDLSHVSEPVDQLNQETELTTTQIHPEVISDHFTASGLQYSETQIADFYTALQTKGFVVLSGISGTGKSKIATGFTELLPLPNDRSNNRDNLSTMENPLGHVLVFTTTVNSSAKKSGTAVLQKDAHQLDFLKPGESLHVPVYLDGRTGMITFMRRGGSIRPGYPSMEYSKEVQDHIADWPIGTAYRVLLQREGKDSAVIERIESHLSSISSQAELKNTLFLSVRPDWRDSTSLLGYYNPLTKTYEWTDFLRFVLDAAENYRSDDPIAWFVILDEMNLAHVEYYFADLLSVLESGRETDPNHDDYGFTDQPLRLTYPDTVVNEAPPTEVRLPPNLYIIGTVNMDETTHAFSPKVLDRAFTMELTEVDFSDYPRAASQEGAGMLDDAAKQQFLRAFSQNGEFPQIRKDEIREFVLENDDIRLSIQRLNENLANYRFHFGYRVFDEIMQFLANAEKNGMYPDPLVALDSASFMKILPKFSGSEARVGLPLAALIEWANDPFAAGEGAVSLERTLKRARYMQNVLQTDGFVTAF